MYALLKRWYNCAMKKKGLMLATFLATVAFATAVGPVSLGDAVFIDTEATTNVPLPACAGEVPHTFAFALDFVGSPSNAVEIAFGVDADADGVLAPDEARLVVGWDCSSWFVRNEAEGETMSEPASVSSGVQSLHMLMRTGWGDRLSSFSANAGSAPLFPLMTPAPPSWIHDCSWNLCRGKSRGVGSHQASFLVSSSPEGLKIIVR